MTNTYLNQLINEFDQEFESLIIPFPNSYVVAPVEEQQVEEVIETIQVIDNTTAENSASQKLTQIEELATKISAERYNPNYNPEICLANLLNYILSSENQDMQNDFFQLLNQDSNSNLDQVLTDFDFYLDNPFKKKAEKILSKIEKRINKLLSKSQKNTPQKVCKDNLFDAIRYTAPRYGYKRRFLNRERADWELIFLISFGVLALVVALMIWLIGKLF